MQRTIFLYGLVIVAFGLFVVKMLLVNGPEPEQPQPQPESAKPLERDAERVIALNANEPGWKPVGRGPMRITADGAIDIGGLKTGPGDKKRPGDDKALAPKLPYGALICRIGEQGQPFFIGNHGQVASKEIVYLAINDSDYSDNSGSYIVTIIGGNKY
jgi:hypothetical protein